MTDRIIFFGHSMGAKIVYELEKILEKEGKGAAQIILSGCRVPHKKEPNPIYHLPDEQFKSELGRFDGTPKEILENKELLDFFLPMLRADFTMDETYYTDDNSVLDCPITVFGGRSDKEANPEEIAAWGAYTREQFRYRIFEGGHFFIREKEEEVLLEVRKVISIFQDESL
jgi:surfactin synthase thioesterase subunit